MNQIKRTTHVFNPNKYFWSGNRNLSRTHQQTIKFVHLLDQNYASEITSTINFLSERTIFESSDSNITIKLQSA